MIEKCLDVMLRADALSPPQSTPCVVPVNIAGLGASAGVEVPAAKFSQLLE